MRAAHRAPRERLRRRLAESPTHTELTRLELAWGIALGTAPGLALTADATSTPRAAFAAAVLPALRRPPCLVSFSGGRDSSVVLAIATDVARQHGLPDPIPVTHRFAAALESEESEWQEHVVASLGLAEWQRMEWTDELDTVGPYAQRSLRQFGVASPSNLHFLLPIIDAAHGGSVLTGVGGDELFEVRSRPVMNRALYRRDVATWRDLPGLAAGSLPAGVRVRRSLRSTDLDYPWLRRPVMEILKLEYARWETSMSARYDRAMLEWWWPSRLNQLFRAHLTRVAASADVLIEHPFSAPGFLAAMAAEYGAAGPRGRATGLRRLAGDVVSERILTRTSKASFDAAFATSWTREFVAEWDGEGVDVDLVDPDALSREWSKETPEPHSLLLLQAAWLASHPDGLENQSH